MTTQLPPQGPPEPDEKLPGEAELAALYRQLPQSEPGPAVDAAVLHAAARALVPDEESPAISRERQKAERGDGVHQKPVTPLPVASPARSNNRPRWLIALSSAATLVLAAGLAWRTRELPPATSAPTAMDSAAPARAMAPAALPQTTPPATAMQSAESVPLPPSEPSKQPPPKLVVAQMSAPAAHASRKTAANRNTERAYSKARVIGGLRHAAPAPMPMPSAALQETSSNAIEAAPEAPAKMATAPPAPPAPPSPAPSVDGITVPNTSDTPAQELDKIQQLFKQGHDDEARQRLAAFQHAHPHWDLPPELRARLRKP